MRKILSNRTLLILLGLIGLYILCRSIHFTENLNFSTEQADFAKKSFELWQNKKIELIGPAISFRNNGRMIFQGSITYYFQWLFLIPGKFDPVVSSYLFMLFGSAMLIPLYFGVKNLSNEKKAIFVCLIYTLLPLYIDYSRFFWNPNYQFVLTPLVVWLASVYIKKRNRWWLFGESILLGVQLMFHYQYLVVIGIFFIFHLIKRNIGLKEVVVFLAGIAIGFSPMIFFELRHNFYNVKTLLMFLNKKNNVFEQGGGLVQKHYYLSIILVFIALLANIKKIKINWIFVGIFGLILLSISLTKIVNKPSNGFGMAKNWNYIQENKVFEIIKNNNSSNYNIANLIYNTKASVQKYLLKVNGINIDEDNYRTNDYLYIITDQIKPLEDPAYEVNWFKPSELIQTWKIHDDYNLFLYKRI